MKCPVDNATLLITDRSGIEIDYCPECRGVWLDRGELDKLIQGSEHSQPRYESHDERRYEPRNERHYEDSRSSHHGKDHPKKKESFLGDLFDF
ncbi:MAG TPA: zf-TFIIB domain-containing protein [Candidatus Saccharimonadales bacterium]|nr:zf-TFIIB domain-containing protein [Candidatus Saccharimonadales bacterium]